MLHAEQTRYYYIHPSWLDLPHCWEDWERLFADPLRSGYLDETDFIYIRQGYYTSSARPVQLLDGPAGGGIIVVPRWPDPEDPSLIAPGPRWLGELIIRKYADMCQPPGTALAPQRTARVAYLEPKDDPGLRLLGVAPRAKVYVCAATLEHVDSDPGVYWLIDAQPAKRMASVLKQVPQIAQHFGLDVTALPGRPEALREETLSWFSDPEAPRAWFRVVSDADGAGFHFAVLVYVGLHLRKVGGRGVRSVHLVSQIEGKPNARRGWGRK